MNEQEIQEIFQKEFPEDMTFEEITKKLDTLSQTVQTENLRCTFCNILTSAFSKDFVKYDFSAFSIDETPLGQLIFHNVARLNKDRHFYWAFYYFLKNDYSECKKRIHLLLNSIDYTEVPFAETDFVELFAVPFKNAFEGFWNYIADELEMINTAKGMTEFCNVMEVYYTSSSTEEVIDILLSYNQKYQDVHVISELIGYAYYSAFMWNNSIAYLERVDEPIFFYQDEIFWMLAWAYGKGKNYTKEEAYYRKCQEIFPDRDFLQNNLGYSLLKQKRYSEARTIFQACIAENKDMPYAANNYIRVLLATGRYGDAKQFVKETTCHISKSLREKVANLSNTNARLKKDIPVVDICEEVTIHDALNIGMKMQQFSNEKLLEDELSMRIELGIPVFGLNLKMYRRLGEYGRQYIIPIGRLDLLCEDSNGNLYVIELKKDSGYDDVYKQTANYIEWFENSEKFREKKVYGIICLNNPAPDLIKKVHEDSRMKLFEYQISYTER